MNLLKQWKVLMLHINYSTSESAPDSNSFLFFFFFFKFTYLLCKCFFEMLWKISLESWEVKVCINAMWALRDPRKGEENNWNRQGTNRKEPRKENDEWKSRKGRQKNVLLGLTYRGRPWRKIVTCYIEIKNITNRRFLFIASIWSSISFLKSVRLFTNYEYLCRPYSNSIARIGKTMQSKVRDVIQ